MYTMTYLMYKYERRLITAAERRAADVHAGQAAAALRDLRLSLGRAFRRADRAQPARRVADVPQARAAADAATGSARVPSGTR